MIDEYLDKSGVDSLITAINSKTSNIGTVTGVKINGTTNNPTNGVVDLGTVLTSETKANWAETNSSSAAYIQNKPDISEVTLLYYNDTTGVLKTSGYSITFQETLDDYDMLRCHFRPTAGSSSDTMAVPGAVLYIDLSDENSFGTGGEYTGSVTVPYLNNTNRSAFYVAMVNSAKSQFRVVSQQSIYGTGTTDMSDSSHGVYCYKIEGVKTGGTTSGSSGGSPVTFTESDPTVPSHVKSITQADITNWNSKTSNTGTITAVTMNGVTVANSGNADLGAVAVEVTMNRNTYAVDRMGTIDLGDVLTSHQNIKTINNTSLVGTGNVTINALPTVTSSDNGKILQVVNGAWTLVSPATLYSGSGTPSNAQGNNGDLYVQI